MALVAENAADRVGQLALLTERLSELIARETALIDAHEPPLTGELGEEKARLANLYRQEMTRIGDHRDLIAGASPAALDQLRAATARFRTRLTAHERALASVKAVSE